MAYQIATAEVRASRTLKIFISKFRSKGHRRTSPVSPDRNKKYFTYKIELDMSDETVLPFNLRTLFCSQQFVTWALTVRAVDRAGNSGQFSFPQFMQGMSQSSKIVALERSTF